jgi:hypothetical protein
MAWVILQRIGFYIVFYLLYILRTFFMNKDIVVLRQGASWFSAANQGDDLHGVQSPCPRELQLHPAVQRSGPGDPVRAAAAGPHCGAG